MHRIDRYCFSVLKLGRLEAKESNNSINLDLMGDNYESIELTANPKSHPKQLRTEKSTLWKLRSY